MINHTDNSQLLMHVCLFLPLHICYVHASLAKILFLKSEVKDLEGYAASLSQTGGLDPEKHRVIALALERGLLKRLHIGGDKMRSIEADEENLLKDSEEFYVKSKACN